jgi:cadmium resistance transport/sequestration family protein
MDWLTQVLTTSITSFVATNIDDIAILMLFFAQVSSTFRPRHIVIGQYLGFLGLIAASLPGFFGGLLIPKAWIGWLGLLPIAIGISYLVNRAEAAEIQTVTELQTLPKSRIPPAMTRLVAPQSYQVAAVTLANGGDNIGIYVPLFANSSPAGLLVVVSVFLILLGVWCYVAFRLTRYPTIAAFLTRHGQKLVPLVLIVLGIYILADSLF